MTSGMIFNIQRFSIYDGPGARTAVFFKGCNLKCRWCHNPESIPSQKLLEFYPDKCIGCGGCFSACPTGAHILSPEKGHLIDRSKCTRCFTCADSCFAEALVSVGEWVTSETVVKSCLTDLENYRGSGGGVTCTGVECMQQIDFLCEILRELTNQKTDLRSSISGLFSGSHFYLQPLPNQPKVMGQIPAAATTTQK